MKYKTFRAMVVAGALLGAVGVGYALRGSGDRAPTPPPPAPAPMAAPAPPPRPAPAAPAPSGAAAHVTYLLETLGRPATSDKIKDALGRGGVKINVYNENGRWARAKVDLDRDEKWDEKWWTDGAQVRRSVAPADDERYGGAETMR